MTVTDPTGHAPAGKGGGGGSITEAQVRAAWARAGALQKKAAAAGIAAAGAAGEAAVAKAAAFAAATLASALNTAAQVAEWAANKAAQAAAFAFQKAQAMLQQAEEWQRRADDAWASARQHLDASHGWNPFSDAANAWDAAKETGIAVYDEAQAGLRYAAYGVLEGAAIGLQFAADQLRDAAHLAKEKAQSAARFAHKAATLASQLWRSAVNLAGYARAMEGAALAAASYAASLAGEYAAQQARKAIKKAGRLLRKVGRELKKIGKQAGRIATRVAKAWYKYSGTQDVVSCVTHGNGSSCAKVAVTVALTVVNAAQGGLDPATDGAEVAVLASDAGAAAAEEAGSTAAEQAGSTAARDAAESCGLSFTASTMVLLASGKAVPISALKPGEKVLATNTKTGKTQAQTIAAVLVNHDTSLYDLTVRANGRTATIHTTSNHPFWDATTGRWVKAGALKYGTYLRVPSGRTATVLGGTVPAASSGDMWDLTVLNDHDFYVQAATIAILAHNCAAPAAKPSGNFWQRHPKLTAYVFAGLKLVNHTKVIEDGTAGYQTPPAETAIERFVDEATSDPFKFKRP